MHIYHFAMVLVYLRNKFLCVELLVKGHVCVILLDIFKLPSTSTN